jgi:hypothetical protein
MLHPRWLPRRNQWNLVHLMILVASCGMLLGLSQLSPMLVMVLAVGSALVVGPFLLARRGFKLVDIVTVLVIVLLTFGFLLPAMVQTRYRTAGRRTLPISVPPNITALFRQD